MEEIKIPPKENWMGVPLFLVRALAEVAETI